MVMIGTSGSFLAGSVSEKDSDNITSGRINI